MDDDDILLMKNIVDETTYFEVCNDGIDNNCDGIIDCEEH